MVSNNWQNVATTQSHSFRFYDPRFGHYHRPALWTNCGGCGAIIRSWENTLGTLQSDECQSSWKHRCKIRLHTLLNSYGWIVIITQLPGQLPTEQSWRICFVNSSFVLIVFASFRRIGILLLFWATRRSFLESNVYVHSCNCFSSLVASSLLL